VGFRGVSQDFRQIGIAEQCGLSETEKDVVEAAAEVSLKSPSHEAGEINGTFAVSPRHWSFLPIHRNSSPFCRRIP
jgi:hypothetical protein